MKKKSRIKIVTIATITAYVMTYLILLPCARISYAQDIVPTATVTPTAAVAPTMGVVPTAGVTATPTSAAPTLKGTTSRLYLPVASGMTILHTVTKNNNEPSPAPTDTLLVQDHVSSTRVIETIGGAPAVSQTYYPYGTTQDSQNTTTDKQFTSHRALDDTDVYHAGARFYNPQLGMFVQADKVEGPNRYVYAKGMPIIANDPSGKIVPLLIIAALALGGGAFFSGFNVGRERQTQINQYGSVQEPSKVVIAGVEGAATGAAVGAGVGYLGAVAAPAAIAAVGAGSAAGGVTTVAGAAAATHACLSGPCAGLAEVGASLIGDLPPTFSVGASVDGFFGRSGVPTTPMRRVSRLPFGQSMGGHWATDAIDSNIPSRGIDDIAREIRTILGPSATPQQVLDYIPRYVAYRVPYDHSGLASGNVAADRAASNTMIIRGGMGGVCRHQAGICAGVARQFGFPTRELVFDVPGGSAHTVAHVDLRGNYYEPASLTQTMVLDASMRGLNGDGATMPLGQYIRSVGASNIMRRSLTNKQKLVPLATMN